MAGAVRPPTIANGSNPRHADTQADTALIDESKLPDWALYYARGQAYERSDRWKEAEADLVQALKRDGRFLQPGVVHEEGATAYCLIAGHHRLEAWKRHFGKLRPIIGATYPLADVPTAHEDLRARRTVGQLVLRP